MLQLDQQDQDLRSREDQAQLLAGDPDAVERELTRWEQAGGSYDEVLHRLRASTADRAEQRRTTAGTLRSQAEQLRDRAAGIRQEIGIRRTMDPDRVEAENAQRAAQRDAEQARRSQQQSEQQHPGYRPPDQGPRHTL